MSSAEGNKGQGKKKEKQQAAPMDVDEPEQGQPAHTSSKKSKGKLPDNLELQRTHVLVGPEMNSHTRTMSAAGMYMSMGVDNSWDLDEFKENFQIKVNKLDAEMIQFDIIGVDPAVVNALRRILIAEVPTVAVEHVFMVNNTSIIQDEVLSHRLGLVPLQIDPALLEFKMAEEILKEHQRGSRPKKATTSFERNVCIDVPFQAPNEKNTVVFKLDVKCYRKGDTIINEKVLSDQLQYLEHGSEMPEETSCRFAQQGQGHLFSHDKPRPVNKDILLAKLRPGQCIELEAHCIKGMAKEHAKWSPVATAWYTLLPEVVLLKQPDEAIAAQLEAAAPGLFTRGSNGTLQVGNARDHAMHLEKIRALLEQPAVAEAVQYRKRKDHFIFTIESTGVLSPEVLFQQALDILHDKAHRLTTLCY